MNGVHYDYEANVVGLFGYYGLEFTWKEWRISHEYLTGFMRRVVVITVAWNCFNGVAIYGKYIYIYILQVETKYYTQDVHHLTCRH